MCTVCGCAPGEARIEGHAPSHGHGHDHPFVRRGGPAGGPPPAPHGCNHHHSKRPPRGPHPRRTQARMVQIEKDILGKNDAYAAANRARFEALSLFVLNLVSSPGSGKTTLLTRSIERLGQRLPLAVIEGDQQTDHDAARIRATGARAVQVNTGKGCHLDAHMVGHALDRLDNLEGGLLFIENVGNLVCPAAFDLGEAHKVAILSVTEGEDKPLKYPDMFHAADLMLLNKTDLLPHLDFDVEACLDYARRVNPAIEVIQVSARSGEGLDAWLDWLLARRAARLRQRIAALREQAAALEALL